MLRAKLCDVPDAAEDVSDGLVAELGDGTDDTEGRELKLGVAGV